MQAELTVRSGRDVGRRYVVRMGQRFLLGRGRDAQVRIEDEKASRRHCSVELTPDGLLVTDLASRNGTFLGEQPLEPHEGKLACPDDVLQIGDHVLHLLLIGLDATARRERARTRRLDAPLLSRDEFEILGEIGRGATGRVYAANQKLLGRNVAIKVLRSEMDEDSEVRERFLREGRLTLKIDSPYVVEVYDLRMVDGRVYLIMELVNGLSAKDRLFTGPMPIPEALLIGEQVAEALVAAHQAGVIHRDIKPANILLTSEGRAKLSDFGIAKELDALESLTHTGEGMGTLAYVSPEQATEAKDVTFATDLYSLGATLYHLVGGRPPFLPQSAKVLLQIMDQPAPPLGSLRQDCPVDVIYLIHHLLEKDPADRPLSARAVADDLRRVREKHYPDFVPGRPEGWSLADSTDATNLLPRPPSR